MTTIGKFLVFANLFIGMAFLSWSVGLYTQKLDWVDRTNSAGEKVEGEITRLKAEIDRLTLETKAASKVWGDTYVALENTEKVRDDRRKAFATRLIWAKTNDTKGTGFYADVPLPGSALISIDQLGAAVKGPDGNPLRGAETLLQTVAANEQATKMAAEEIEALKKQQQQEQVKEKLLQERVTRHTAIYENLLNEQRYLEAFEINWYEQLGTVQRRKAQLAGRLAEFN